MDDRHDGEFEAREAYLKRLEADVIIDVECPTCNGAGEVCGVTPSRRSRFVGMDDLSPDDYTVKCPRCLGTGLVEHDLNEDCEDE